MKSIFDDLPKKPLGRKSYGSIAHLPGSRMGPADHKCHEGQATIALTKPRDKYDRIFVQEKLDGSNVGAARMGDLIIPLTRAGYVANTSPYEMHHRWYDFVFQHAERFRSVLKDGERLCGEWLIQAHGTRYDLPHEPFVAFDIMREADRMPWYELIERIDGKFVTPSTDIGPASIEWATQHFGEYGMHGAIDPIEGFMWRVERHEKNKPACVDFLVKYVRPEKKDGIYLTSESGSAPVMNTWHEFT